MYGIVYRLWVSFVGEPHVSMAVVSLNQGKKYPRRWNHRALKDFSYKLVQRYQNHVTNCVERVYKSKTEPHDANQPNSLSDKSVPHRVANT